MLNNQSLAMLAESMLADLGVWHDRAAVANLAGIGAVCESYDEAERIMGLAAMGAAGDSLEFADFMAEIY